MEVILASFIIVVTYLLYDFFILGLDTIVEFTMVQYIPFSFLVYQLFFVTYVLYYTVKIQIAEEDQCLSALRNYKS